jgi:hypothetical protein
MVIPSFCVIKLYYLGNYQGMAVNYHGIKLFYNIGQKVCFKCQTQNTLIIFCGNLPQYFDPRNSTVKITTVICQGIVLITLAPELTINLWQLKTAIFLHWCLICALPLNSRLEPICGSRKLELLFHNSKLECLVVLVSTSLSGVKLVSCQKMIVRNENKIQTVLKPGNNAY